MSWVQTSLKREDGASMVEYSLMLVLVAAVCIVVIKTLGVDVASLLSRIAW